MGLRWEGNGHIMMSWIFWSTTCSVELWKWSRESKCNWRCIHWSRWNWNRQLWTTGRRKYNSWPKMEGGSRRKEQPAGIKRGGKIQKLTSVDIAKQYLDSLKEIGNEWRRSWVRISVTILIEQKRHRLLSLALSLALSLSLSLYIYIYNWRNKR